MKQCCRFFQVLPDGRLQPGQEPHDHVLHLLLPRYSPGRSPVPRCKLPPTSASPLTRSARLSFREGAAVSLGAAGARRSSGQPGPVPEQGQLLAVGQEGCSRAPPEKHLKDGRQRLLWGSGEQTEELDGAQDRVSAASQASSWTPPSLLCHSSPLLSASPVLQGWGQSTGDQGHISR